jgi:hypothetical protein
MARPFDQVMLADPATAPTIVFDPAGRVRRPPSRIRWLCPHVIGAIMLKALAMRSRIDIRLAGARAQLN